MTRKAILRRDMNQCQTGYPGCTGVATQVDHVNRPEDGGGEYDPFNLRASCKPCNIAKRNRELAARAKRADRDRGKSLQRW